MYARPAQFLLVPPRARPPAHLCPPVRRETRPRPIPSRPRLDKPVSSRFASIHVRICSSISLLASPPDDVASQTFRPRARRPRAGEPAPPPPSPFLPRTLPTFPSLSPTVCQPRHVPDAASCRRHRRQRLARARLAQARHVDASRAAAGAVAADPAPPARLAMGRDQSVLRHVPPDPRRDRVGPRGVFLCQL